MVVERNNNGRITAIFGMAPQLFAAIITLSTVAVGVVIWLVQLNYTVTTLNANFDPKGFVRMEIEIQRIAALQAQVLQGETGPQQRIRDDITRVKDVVADLNSRCGSVHDKIDELRRRVDQNEYKLQKQN